MSEQFPLPRSVRDDEFTSIEGQTVFGPPAWLLYDAADVLVFRAAPGSTSQVLVDSSEYTVTPVSTLPGLFSIVFAAGQAAAATIRVKGARVHERLTNVTQQGIIRSLPLEQELDRIGVVLQELRRDNDRSVNVLDDTEAAAAAAEAAETAAIAAQALAEAANTAAGLARAGAEAARDTAAGYAAGVNLPAILGGDAGKLLQVKGDETGYQHAAISLTDFLTKADNLAAVADAATAFGNIKQAATEAATGVVEKATAAEILSGAANVVTTPQRINDAMAAVALTDGANIAVDLAAGVYFSVTLAGNRQLDNPTGHVVGRTIALRVTQDGTGGRTLSYDTQYDFGQDTAPILSSLAGAVDLIFFHVMTTSKMVFAGIRRDVG